MGKVVDAPASALSKETSCCGDGLVSALLSNPGRIPGGADAASRGADGRLDEVTHLGVVGLLGHFDGLCGGLVVVVVVIWRDVSRSEASFSEMDVSCGREDCGWIFAFAPQHSKVGGRERRPIIIPRFGRREGNTTTCDLIGQDGRLYQVTCHLPSARAKET